MLTERVQAGTHDSTSLKSQSEQALNRARTMLHTSKEELELASS